MATSRYNNRETIRNRSERYFYSPIFRNRGLKTPVQFTVANLKHITVDQAMDLQIETKLWSVGEKYFNLANEFYGDPEYWWVIAWYNRRPLESDFRPGDVVEIPTPIELVFEYLDIF